MVELIVRDNKDWKPRPRVGMFDQYYRENVSPERIFGITNDPYSGHWSNSSSEKVHLPRKDEILIKRGDGGSARSIEIYMRLLHDSQVLSSFDKFATEIIQRPWAVIPADSSSKSEYVARFVKTALDRLGFTCRQSASKGLIAFPGDGFNNLIRGLTEAYILGISGAGIIWHRKGAHILPASVEMVDTRRIEITMNSRGDVVPRLTVWENSGYTGKQIPARSFIMHRYWANRSFIDPWGMGLGRSLYPLVEFRRNLLSMWLQYADKNTSPSAIASYPVGLSKEDHDNLFETAKTLGQGTVALIPEGVGLNYLTPGSSAPGVYQGLIQYLDQQIAWLITGEKEPSQSGQVTGSLQQQDRLADSNRVKKANAFNETLEDTINNTLVRWIVELNFGWNTPLPVVKRNFADLNDRSNKQAVLSQLSMLKGLGYTINDLDWLKQQLNIPSLTYDPALLQQQQGLPTEADNMDEQGENPAPSPEEGGFADRFAEPEDKADGKVTLKAAAEILGVSTEVMKDALGLESDESLVDIEELVKDFLSEEGDPEQAEKRYKDNIPYGTEYYHNLSSDLYSTDEEPATFESKVTSMESVDQAVEKSLRGKPRQIGYDQVTRAITPYEQSSLNLEVTEDTSNYELLYAIETSLKEIQDSRGRDIRPSWGTKAENRWGELNAVLLRLQAVYDTEDIRHEALILREEVRELEYNLFEGYKPSRFNYDDFLNDFMDVDSEDLSYLSWL